MRGIESDPAKLENEGLGPGVTGLPIDDAVVAAEVAASIARRDAEAACLRFGAPATAASMHSPRLKIKCSLAGRKRAMARNRVQDLGGSGAAPQQLAQLE